VKNFKVKRTFIIGEEWLYYKIYCGVKVSDSILINLISPIAEELYKQKFIDKWFFIRYSDPEPHLRVRFHVIKIENISKIILKIKDKILPYVNNNQVWNVQLATYNREFERYGKKIIETVESYFFYDSLLAIYFIQNDGDGDKTRFLNVLKSVENIVNIFNFDIKRRLSFLNKMGLQYKNEFEVDKIIKKELSNKYRELQREMFNNYDSNNSLYSINTQLQNIVNMLLTLKKGQELEQSLENLLASFIHMTINRNFRSKQRLYEMMIYDFLHRNNNSKFIRDGRL